MADEIAGSLNQTVGREPYGHYDAATGTCPVSWDDELQAWVVYDYESIKAVLRTDIDAIRMPELDDPVLPSIDGSVRALKYLSGEKQRRIHRWYIQTMAPDFIARQRETAIQPIVEQALEPLLRNGKADLAADFAARIPIRAAAAVLGLPWQDDDWISRAREFLDVIGYFFASRLIVTEEDTQRAVTASANLNELFRPFIEQRRSGHGDDMISRLWRDGPGLSPDWTELDVFGQVRTTMQGATDTTTHTMCNMLHFLMTLPGETREALRAGNEKIRANFIEESLRLNGTVHFRVRKANRDFSLHDVQIKRDDTIVPVLASGNRDPGHYACPHDLDLARTAPRDHLAFNFGPRTCVGQALARAELQEALATVLTKIPDVRLDPDAPPPALSGFTNRSYRPLNVLFTPEGG